MLIPGLFCRKAIYPFTFAGLYNTFMQFGKVADPEKIDFRLPADDPETLRVLQHTGTGIGVPEIYIGCPKWNKTDMKGFYPPGIKDELRYYASQFNSIELNATFYNMPTVQQVEIWKNKTPEGFKFFPKLNGSISHMRRLNNVQLQIEQFCDAVSFFNEKLGMAFLQLHDSFSPEESEKLCKVLDAFPRSIPLAVELRNEHWFSGKDVFGSFASLLERCRMTNIIVDVAGRRDMLHMRLTGPDAFIRFVGANDTAIDRKRLEEWVQRIIQWRDMGLRQLCFFVHQNAEREAPELAVFFIERLNRLLNINLRVPALLPVQTHLFD